MHLQELELMKGENNLYGQALALNNLARTYEHLANLAKAAEALEAVSQQQINVLPMTQNGTCICIRWHLCQNMHGWF